MFHVSLLKPFRGLDFKVQPLPPQLFEELELLVQPEDILQTCLSMSEVEILVKWVGLPKWEATWLPLSTFKAQFSNYNPEGKVVLHRGVLLGLPSDLFILGGANWVLIKRRSWKG